MQTPAPTAHSELAGLVLPGETTSSTATAHVRPASCDSATTATAGMRRLATPPAKSAHPPQTEASNARSTAMSTSRGADPSRGNGSRDLDQFLSPQTDHIDEPSGERSGDRSQTAEGSAPLLPRHDGRHRAERTGEHDLACAQWTAKRPCRP